MKIKRFFRGIVAFLLSLLLFVSLPCFAFAESRSDLPFPNSFGSEKIYLYNFESDSILINRKSEEKTAPASTVKIMTGLLAIDMLKDRLDESITVTNEMLTNVEGYTVGFKVGMTVKIRDVLYGLICGSGNDAALIVATLGAGDVETFVNEMNLKAKEFGMLDTTYTNPTGIDDRNMMTTLNDIVKISKLAIKNETFMDMCGAVSHTFKSSDSEEIIIRNRNALISNHSAIGYRNNKVKGLNAGATDMGGYCASAYATDGKNSYLCIVMDGKLSANESITSYSIVNKLLDHAFDNYTYTQIASKGDVLDKITVDFALPSNGRDIVTVQCVLDEDIYAYAPANINYKNDLTYKTYFYEQSLTAPISKNTEVGGVDIYYKDSYIASGKLLTKEDVQESVFLLTMNKMKKFYTSRFMITFLIISVLSICIYFYFTVWRKKIKKKRIVAKEKGRK